jgi:mannose-6-phosphate isomerase
MDRLDGKVQRYAWGDHRLIAQMQGRPPTGEPEAELWLGAHPVAPSTLTGSGRSLTDAVTADPGAMLGPGVEERFGQLPFLLKVLAAAKPLSIQAHPSRAQAEAGFAREAAAGIAWDSPTRTYRDPNHKPELICALTRFEAKCGFRPLDATQSLFGALARTASGSRGAGDGGSLSEACSGLADLANLLRAGLDPAGTLRQALRWLLQRPPVEAADLVAQTVAAARQLAETRDGPGLDTVAAFGPELAWTAELEHAYPGDVGVVVALLLNHVVLEPGQAMFLAAGNLHSYLRGGGVELMANSDNVVRGGLTPKHVDVEELAAIVDTTPGPPPVQTAAGACHRFESPVPDFSLTRLVGPVVERFEPTSAEIVLVTDGEITIERDREATPVGRGQSVLISWSDGPYRLAGASGATTAWRATAGDLAS